MALVKYGALISEARGKEAGLVFSRNSYGGYVKQKVSPINPQTDYQQTQRALLGGFAQAWQGLEETEKDEWKQFGQQMLRVNRFGDQTTFTGFNAFIKANRNRKICGLSLLTKPVTVQAFPQLAPTYAIDDASMVVNFTPNPLGTDFYLVVDATPPIFTGRRFVKNFYRFVGASSSSPLGTFSLTALYPARFGSLPAAGNYVGLRLRMIDGLSGWDSSYYVHGEIVEAAP